MKEQKEILTLLPWQAEEQIDSITYFLESVHPHLKDGEGFRPCVEIRPINRGEKDYMLSKSLLLWDLEAESIARLRAFLERHNGQTTCLFYSVFSYDNHNTGASKSGKSKKTSRINTNSAISTSEIALDFDSISFDAYVDLVDRFEALGIYALWVFSGHGYQAHILLDNALEDKDLLRRYVYKFRSKGFDCDPACTDPARLMRLPYTFNCKCFSDPVYESETDDPPMCKIMQESGFRYSLDDLLQKLDKLPTVSEADEKEYLSEISKAFASNAKKKETPATEDDICVRKVEYPYLSNHQLPDAVVKMLAYTPHGVRNKVLGYLIRLFKTQYKLSKSQIYEILTIWAEEACEPAYSAEDLKKDFTRLYYDYNGLGYDSVLAKHFGSIDFQELITLRKKDIRISNAFFRDFPVLDGKVVRLYLAIKLLEHIDEPATTAKLCEILNISHQALRPSLQELLKSKHGYIKRGVRKLGEPDVYYTHRGYSIQDGYMEYTYNDIKCYITELYDKGARGHGELKLYLFMRWKFYSGDIFMSQTRLGENINVAQNTISDIVYRLQSKHFIKIRKVQRYNCFDSCEYHLLR